MKNTLMRFVGKIKSLISPKRKAIPKIEYDPQAESSENTPSVPLKPEKPKKKFILSFDGGGNKTIIEVMVLKKIEAVLKEFDADATLQSAFDLFAGTSAGGLNALILAYDKNSTWADLKKMSVLKAETIFTKSKKPFYKMMSNKYSSSGLCEVLSEIFKDDKLEKASCPFLVMAFDTRTLKPVMISNTNEFKDISFVEAGTATTAAPVYFSPLRLNHEGTAYNLIDGGITANNPSLFAYKAARKLFEDADEYHVISLGSYKNPEHFDNTDGTFSWIDITKGYGLPIQKVYHIAGEETASEIMNAIRDVRYLRIENRRGQYSDIFRVDSTSEHDTIRLMEIGEQIADEYEDKIRDFLKERFS